jgi:hypothetical protein
MGKEGFQGAGLFLEDFFGPFPFSDVYAQLQDQGGAVAVGKGIGIGAVGPPPR